MAAYSGTEGSVQAGASTDVNELLHWDLEYGNDPKPYFSRAGAGAQQTVSGPASGSGTIRVNFDAADPIAAQLPSGSLVSMVLTMAAGRTCTGTARIGKHKYNTDQTGEPETVDISFVTHGSWTVPTT